MSPGWIVFLNGSGQPECAFLDQVEEVEAFALVALGEIHNQPEVGRDHLILGLFTAFDRALFIIAVLAGGAAAAREMAAFGQAHHGLNFPTHR